MNNLNKSIFKAYDIRGIYPTDINPEAMTCIGKACAHMFNEGTLVLAYDTRHGSPELAAELEKSILEEAQKINKSISIINIGLSTTPMFYFHVNNFRASGGCMITASHNPSHYNGVKMVKEGAETISGTKVLEVVETIL